VRAARVWDEGQHRLVSFCNACASRKASGWFKMPSDSQIASESQTAALHGQALSFLDFIFLDDPLVGSRELLIR